MISIDFQKIYDILSDVLPEEWKKVVFRAEYTTGSYTMKYYVQTLSGEYIDCYNLPNISDDSIVDAYIRIDEVVYEARQQEDNTKLWNLMTIVIDNEGRFKTDFQYDVVIDDEHMKSWTNKYLK